MTSNSARRLATRALRGALRLTAPIAIAAVLTTVGLWAAGTGPQWRNASDHWAVLLYGACIVGVKSLADFLARTLIDLIDPDRWDGDNAFEISRSIAELRADIDNGADIDEVMAGLHDSKLMPELLATVHALGVGYASRGDDDQSRRLVAAFSHLRDATKNLRPFHSPTAVTEAGSATARTPK